MHEFKVFNCNFLGHYYIFKNLNSFIHVLCFRKHMSYKCFQIHAWIISCINHYHRTNFDSTSQCDRIGYLKPYGIPVLGQQIELNIHVIILCSYSLSIKTKSLGWKEIAHNPRNSLHFPSLRNLYTTDCRQKMLGNMLGIQLLSLKLQFYLIFS